MYKYSLNMKPLTLRIVLPEMNPENKEMNIDPLKVNY